MCQWQTRMVGWLVIWRRPLPNPTIGMWIIPQLYERCPLMILCQRRSWNVCKFRRAYEGRSGGIYVDCRFASELMKLFHSETRRWSLVGRFWWLAWWKWDYGWVRARWCRWPWGMSLWIIPCPLWILCRLLNFYRDYRMMLWQLESVSTFMAMPLPL